MKYRNVLQLVFVSTILPSQGALIAYEGFDTANAIGSDASAAGVTGSGFSAYGSTNFQMDLEVGLGYTDGVGNTLVSAGKSAGMDVVVSGTQNLHLDLSSTILNSGTIYISFLMEITAGNSWGLTIGLQSSDVGNSASPTSASEAVYRSTSTNHGIYGDAVGIDIRTGPDSTPAANTLSFFVAELNMDTEAMTGFLNPRDLSDIAGSAAFTFTDTVSTGTWEDMSQFVFSLGSNWAGTVDEIRIGDTVGDVTPFTAVPEPSSLALLCLSGVALGLRRRSESE